MHQGESNTNNKRWPEKVKAIYNNLLKDLNCDPDSLPLLAGEVVNADQDGACASMNSIIAELPKAIPNAHVISSAGCKSRRDRLHFTAEGYRELGKRYGEKMLSLLGQRYRPRSRKHRTNVLERTHRDPRRAPGDQVETVGGQGLGADRVIRVDAGCCGSDPATKFAESSRSRASRAVAEPETGLMTMNDDSDLEAIGSTRRRASAFSVPGLRWWMMSLIMLGSILNYLTRQTLSVAQVQLKDSMDISDGAVFLDHRCVSNHDHAAADLRLRPGRGRARIGLAIFVVAWSVISMAHAVAGSWKGLAFLRGLMGFAEGSANPAGMKATAEWFPARERGLAGGIYNIGASAGMMLAGPLVAFCGQLL